VKMRPGLPVVVSVGLVLAALTVLIVSHADRPAVTPCPAVAGHSPSPSATACPVVTVTTVPSPRVVVTHVTVVPTVIREPGRTTVIISPAPITAQPTRPTPTHTPTGSPSPACPLPSPVGCLHAAHLPGHR